jgi:hypothetical protein
VLAKRRIGTAGHSMFAGLHLRAVADQLSTFDVASKVLHPRVIDGLAALVPGLFFESCILLANPSRVLFLVSRAALDRYTPILIALLLAFVVGNTFVLWVKFIERYFIWACQFAFRWGLRTLKEFVDDQVRLRQPTAKETSYVKLLRIVEDKENRWNNQLQNIQKAWGQVVAVLLSRYGLKVPQSRAMDEWEPWKSVVGNQPLEDLRGRTLMVVLHATGWSGVSAQHFAPALHTRPFTALCWALIGFGLLHDASLAWYLSHPVKSWQMGFRFTVAELKKVATVKGKPDDHDASINGSPA